MKVVYMFSGQGSQYRQMGSELFRQNAVFRKSMLEMDEVYKSVKGRSILTELYDSQYRVFDPFLSLSVTHPAIFMTGYSLSLALQQEGILPDCIVGFSLGEVVAAAVSGAIDMEDAFKLTIAEADIIEQKCPKGGLIAVLEDTGLYNVSETLREGCSLAAINGPSQFVIAGHLDEISEAKQFLRERGIVHQEMMVSYGFHSPAIDAASRDCSFQSKSYSYRPPAIPLVSGMTALPVQEISSDFFWSVVRRPFNFPEAMERVESMFGSQEKLMCIDAGPSGSLANLVKYNGGANGRSKGFQIMSPFQQDLRKMEEVKEFFKENSGASNNNLSSRNKKLTAYVFPGQGSQRKGMGEGLFERYADITDTASNILGYSIRELCVNDPERRLNKTEYTQPALYVVNALHFLQLQDTSKEAPDFVAGHSLGEYNALFAAGGMDFKTGLRLVQRRGALMAKMKEGGMAAVKGLSEEKIRQIIRQNALDGIDIANYNTQNQIVLSGKKSTIDGSAKFFESAGATLYFPLNVSGAFHSGFMQPARVEFEEFVKSLSFYPLKIPVISNVTSSVYRTEEIRSLLASQLVKPVRWTESISFLLDRGVDTFTEVGPGDVLTKMIYSIRKDANE